MQAGDLEEAPRAPVPAEYEFGALVGPSSYEAVWEVELDPGNLQRKAAGQTGFVVPTGSFRPDTGSGRPAATYRVRPGVGFVDPPLRPDGLRARSAATKDPR